MDLIDRYVHRVRFFLPGRQRDDLVRELAADLRSEVQDNESRLGRPLGDDDVRAILKRWGHPLLVAGRYSPSQYLIGPALYPIYLFVVKLVTAVYLVPWLVVWLGLVILSPTYRAAHQGLALMGPLSTWWNLAFWVLGVVTLVFAAVERAQRRADSLDRWDPAGLPAVHDRETIPRFTSIAEAVAGTVFLLWWTGHLAFPALADPAADVRVTANSLFAGFYWPVLCLTTVTIVLAGINLARPWWSLARASLRLATTLAVVAVAALMLQAGPWVVIDAPGMPAAARDASERVANLSVYWLLLGVGLVAFLVACFEDGRRLYRLVKERRAVSS